MNFREALEKVYKTTKDKEQLNNAFIIYSRVSDLIGNSYENKKKADLFFKINKEINFFSLLLKKKNAKKEIVCKYNIVEELISKEAFIKLIDMLEDFICPKKNKEVVKKEKEIKPKKIKKVKNPKKKMKKQYKVKVKRKIMFSEVVKYSCIGIFIGTILGLIFFGKYIPWNAWQWIIGIGGGIIMLAIFSAIGVVIDDALICGFYGFGTVVEYIAFITNFIFKCIFRSSYNIIFICFSILFFLGSLFLTIATFSDFEEDWGKKQILGMIVGIILFIIGINI